LNVHVAGTDTPSGAKIAFATKCDADSFITRADYRCVRKQHVQRAMRKAPKKYEEGRRVVGVREARSQSEKEGSALLPYLAH